MKKRHNLLRRAALLLILGAWALAASAADRVMTGLGGAVIAYNDGNGIIPLSAGLSIPTLGWKHTAGMHSLQGWVRFSQDGALRQWEGKLRLPDGQICRYRQTLQESDSGTATLQIFATAEADLPVEGIFLNISLPQREFGRGSCALAQPGNPVMSVSFPENPPAKAHLLYGTADRATIRDASGDKTVAIAFPKPRHLTLQDDRAWKENKVSLFTALHSGALRKGQTTSITLSLSALTRADASPARLTLDAGQVRYKFDGAGGNYCFGVDSPVTQYTLEHLRSAWARTEMSLDEWAPRAEDKPASDRDWQKLAAAQDKPGSKLRSQMLMAQTIQKRGIPYAISIWRLPEWLYTDPGAHPGENAYHRLVAPERWQDLLHCLGSYMLYAKEKYGVEPDLFSFNEPDLGIYVLFSPEAHRDAIKSIGAHFAGLGLKTRMLLGDVCNPRDTDTYTTPTAADPEALRYVGAVSFHSWGGATPEQYEAWARTAEKLNLPLLAAEVGPDAQAHRYSEVLNNTTFVLQEMQHYQELLLHARPRATLQWEFTNDYALLRKEGGEWKTTKRFWAAKHLCNLTPPKSDALATASDNKSILFTAFRGQDGLALHILNLGAERKVELSGVPPGFAAFEATQTNASDDFKQGAPVAARGGKAEFTIPAQTLLTLNAKQLK